MSGSTGASQKSSDSTWASALGASDLLGADGTLPNSQADMEDDSVVHASESTQDGDSEQSGEGEQSSQDSSEAGDNAVAGKSKGATQKTSGEKEFITVTDETGRRRKVEIDFSNRESVKKAFAEAAGMRKFQSERDQTLRKMAEVEKRLSERESDWAKLESLYKRGPEAVFDALAGKPGAFKEAMKQARDREKFLETASESEIEALHQREAAEAHKKELELIRKENEEFRNKMAQEKEQAELRSLESRVNPVFEELRFDGQLGSEEDETLFNEMLWNSALKRLEPYEEKQIPLTPELIRREFRQVHSALRRRISNVAEKKAGRVIQQKKQEATEHVQSQVRAAHSSSTDADKLRKAIQSGDTGAIFKNWGSFKNILGNGRK